MINWWREIGKQRNHCNKDFVNFTKRLDYLQNMNYVLIIYRENIFNSQFFKFDFGKTWWPFPIFHENRSYWIGHIYCLNVKLVITNARILFWIKDKFNIFMDRIYLKITYITMICVYIYIIITSFRLVVTVWIDSCWQTILKTNTQ